MKQEVSDAAALFDAKTIVGAGTATGGGIIAHTEEISQLALTGMSILVAIATLIYVCHGIKHRRLQNKLLEDKINK